MTALDFIIAGALLAIQYSLIHRSIRMKGDQIAARLEAAAKREQKILTEVTNLKNAFEDLLDNGSIPTDVQDRIELAFENLEAAQQLTDEVNPDEEDDDDEMEFEDDLDSDQDLDDEDDIDDEEE